MNDVTPVVELSGVRIGQPGGVSIVKGVDLRLAPAQILGLVGESGSGKTTTALSIFGLEGSDLTVTAGEVAVGGQTLRGKSMFRQARGRLVSYVPQNPGTSLNPSMRVGDEINDMLRAEPDGRGASESPLSLMDRVGLPATRTFARRYPHQLSGGQQQRACIAAALARRPLAIVLDEPTTGLDVVTQARILGELLRVRAEEHVAMLYITHDLAVVAQIADRIAVMYAGLIVEEGPAAEILSHPKHPYTRGLMESTPDHMRPRKLRTMRGTAVSVRERFRGCPFGPRCDLHVPKCDDALPPLATVSDRHAARCFEWRRTGPVARTPLDLTSYAATAPDARRIVLALQDIQAEYSSHGRSVVVTRGVSFTLPATGCVALVGESGSGKTTIARVIAGLHPLFTGNVLLEGELLAHVAHRRTLEQRRRIQMVFQNPAEALNPKESVLSAIARPAQLLRQLNRAEAFTEAFRLLDAVRLPASVAEQLPAELSGGEAQRVAIARALAARPDLLVCDEVTSALDVSVQAVVLELLTELRGQFGLSVLFITHDLGVVGAIAERVVVLDRGVICEAGDVGQVLREPQDTYTRTLIKAAPSLTVSLESWAATEESSRA